MRTFIGSLVLTLFIFIGDGVAQPIVNDNVIYRPYIKTVLMQRGGLEMMHPVILLHSPETIELSFDDLDSDLKRYRYTIYHCEADWTLSSDLSESDYINGVREGNIEKFAYSYNTTVPYTHYSLRFPEDNMKPKISGNYILKVYIDDPEQVAFTRRFLVVESTPLIVTGNVKQASNISDKFTRQEVDFDIRLNGFRISDAQREIKVVVRQNDRWDNAITQLKPRFTRSDALDYNFDEENTFSGGNEFRNFDIKSLRYQTERIDKIIYDNEGYRVILLNDPNRAVKNYILEEDINGRRIIKNDDNATDSDLEADYAWVWFSLPVESPVASGILYIAGNLTGWQFDEENRMVYNSSAKAYQKSLYLKQGYYNYIYVVKELATGKSNEALFEGSHWETKNEYTILVYFKEMGGIYDRLISAEDIKR